MTFRSSFLCFCVCPPVRSLFEKERDNLKGLKGQGFPCVPVLPYIVEFGAHFETFKKFAAHLGQGKELNFEHFPLQISFGYHKKHKIFNVNFKNKVITFFFNLK